ncbi:hypothetical protein ILYODFUR_022502 [Ilyodon furcidens]|uniref:Uncharacterized protein n=1 Tax=Ilyodon furcidens TaxID=33524 RepID=A0ABV0TLX4_9TELE
MFKAIVNDQVHPSFPHVFHHDVLSSFPPFSFKFSLCQYVSLCVSYSLLLSMLSFSTPVSVSFLLPSYLSLYPSFHLFQPSVLFCFLSCVLPSLCPCSIPYVRPFFFTFLLVSTGTIRRPCLLITYPLPICCDCILYFKVNIKD